MRLTIQDFDLNRFRPDREALLWAGLVVNLEIILTLTYLLLADVTITEWRYLLYPFVWLNVSAWALVQTTPVARSMRTRYLAGAIGLAYFFLLAYVGGLVSQGVGFHHAGGGAAADHHALGWRLAWLPPGWGPAVFYSGMTVQLTLMPYKVVGYATLAYLVYATVLDAAGSAISGVLGLVSCVSCTWPVLASLAGAIAGSGTAVAAAANEWSYALGTGAFVLTVALLRWRPTIR
jgi:hypothetical protein